MKYLLLFLLTPNPGGAEYATPWVMTVLGVCVGLIVLSFIVRFWRRALKNAVTKKLSRSWATALFTFGIVGIVLIAARVEKIQFVATPILWVVWGIAVVLYLFAQWRLFSMRHYQVLPRVTAEDPRAKYLPGRKR